MCNILKDFSIQPDKKLEHSRQYVMVEDKIVTEGSIMDISSRFDRGIEQTEQENIFSKWRESKDRTKQRREGSGKKKGEKRSGKSNERKDQIKIRGEESDKRKERKDRAKAKREMIEQKGGEKGLGK